jgi:hypothetical protein
MKQLSKSSTGENMKTLIALVAFASTLPILAQAANPERLVCNNRNNSTIVVIEELKDLAQPEGPVNATASMLIVKLNGRKIGDRIPLAGSKEQSAKGPYYELSGPDGYSFFIAAAASKSIDELTVGGKIINVSCE